MPALVTIGTDIETGEEVWIGDRERCGGLYVLGKPRTGKSHLLKSLALGAHPLIL
jgi:DNA replication protein DnaC